MNIFQLKYDFRAILHETGLKSNIPEYKWEHGSSWSIFLCCPPAQEFGVWVNYFQHPGCAADDQAYGPVWVCRVKTKSAEQYCRKSRIWDCEMIAVVCHSLNSFETWWYNKQASSAEPTVGEGALNKSDSFMLQSIGWFLVSFLCICVFVFPQCWLWPNQESWNITKLQ